VGLKRVETEEADFLTVCACGIVEQIFFFSPISKIFIGLADHGQGVLQYKGF